MGASLVSFSVFFFFFYLLSSGFVSVFWFFIFFIYLFFFTRLAGMETAESNGLKGRIHISQSTRNLLMSGSSRYVIEERGQIEVKGKGVMTTHWLLARAARAPSKEDDIINLLDLSAQSLSLKSVQLGGK
jgi:hypothetical protein